LNKANKKGKSILIEGETHESEIEEIVGDGDEVILVFFEEAKLAHLN